MIEVAEYNNETAYYPPIQNPTEEVLCMLCDHLNGKLNKSFKTGHALNECHRCHECYKWDDDETNHSTRCTAKEEANGEHKVKRTERKEKKEIAKCKFWKKGKKGSCKYGDLCTFRHSDDQKARSAKVESGNITCNRCGEFGHHIKDCPPCGKCGNKYHKDENCFKCTGCEQWGHFKKNCTNAVCKECGDAHFSSYCPYMKKTQKRSSK